MGTAALPQERGTIRSANGPKRKSSSGSGQRIRDLVYPERSGETRY